MSVAIKRDNDPFKKYWWVLLLGFGVVGVFVCSPIFSSNALSKAKASSGRGESGFKSSSDSLDSANNPSGAPGGAIDLSMDGSGAYRKRSSDEPVHSYLWGSGVSASGAPAAAAGKDKDKDKDKDAAGAGSASMSASLNRAGKKDDPNGWGGVKPQRGFAPPKANFGGLSGVGSSGGGTGMSMSGSGFGAANSGSGIGSGGGGSISGSAGNVQFGTNKALNSLRSARSVAMMASGLSGDASANMGSRSFDGTGANANTVKSDKGKGFHNKLDTAMAPMNLKQEAIKKPETPEAKKAKKDLEKGKEKDEKEEQDFGMQMIMMVLNIMVGGMAGGMANAMFASKTTGQ